MAGGGTPEPYWRVMNPGASLPRSGEQWPHLYPPAYVPDRMGSPGGSVKEHKLAESLGAGPIKVKINTNTSMELYKEEQVQSCSKGSHYSGLPGILGFYCNRAHVQKMPQSHTAGHSNHSCGSTQALRSWGHSRWQEGEPGSHITLEKRALLPGF